MYRPEFATFADVLEYQLLQSPDDVVALPGIEGVNYRLLDDSSSRVAAGLAAMGVGFADRVLFLGEYSVEYWEVLFACVKLGAVMVPLGPDFEGEDIDDILEDCDARAVFRQPHHKFYNVLGVTEIVVSHAWEDWKSQCAPLMEHCFVTPDTPIVEWYETGGGGSSVLTHQDWYHEHMEGAKSR
ncbi:AMP-binding protein [Corynebacterium sp.]|uniref:AMP-binding protein n=1 Tax=Corynebacterium sp. TaxID=1720 RepID=UPI0026DD71BB|nr:AMP-binding protein [Corynebacterium sp.]MDO5076782.1 AMP-binding protein [Corynebacterium sp.]